MALQQAVSVNPFNMKKSELLEYMTGRCKHRHLYCEHPSCFIKEKGKQIKVGYLDIETSNLKADVGIMLTWAIKTRDKDEHYSGRIKKKEIMEYKFDKRICQELIDALDNYDVIITYYGTGFDIPFMRSRCLFYNLSFPTFGYVKHKDVYYMVKRLLKLHRNSLEAATKFFGIAGKNHVELDIWRKAGFGHKASLDYVYDHNIRDVDILERLHKKLEAYDKGMAKSV